MVACKEFVRRRSFRDELDGLKFLKEPLTEKSAILSHFTAIVHDQKFYILFPFVQHFNLETLFRGGEAYNPESKNIEQKYTLSTRFPHLTDSSKSQRAVIQQAFNLADALQWLHSENVQFGEPNRYLAHMDLNPENVLVDGDPSRASTPVGKWKISDFGLSAHSEPVRRRSRRTHMDAPTTLRDYTNTYTSPQSSLQDICRANGPYQSPEIALEREKASKFGSYSIGEEWLDERQCDVWSFACILCSILAFALDMTKGYNYLLQQRAPFNERDDNFFSFKKSFEWHEDSQINDQNTEIKRGVVKWMDHTKQWHEEWAGRFVTMLKQTMVVNPDPAVRKNMQYIKSALQSLGQLLLEQTILDARSGDVEEERQQQNYQSAQLEDDERWQNDSASPSYPSDFHESLILAQRSKTVEIDSDGSPSVDSHAWMNTAGISPTGASSPHELPSEDEAATLDTRNQIGLRKAVKLETSWSFQPDGLPVKALTVESSGEHIAFLSKDKNTVCVWPTSRPTANDPFPGKTWILQEKLNEPKLRLNYPHLIVLGNGTMKERIVSQRYSHHDFCARGSQLRSIIGVKAGDD